MMKIFGKLRIDRFVFDRRHMVIHEYEQLFAFIHINSATSDDTREIDFRDFYSHFHKLFPEIN